MKKFLWKVGINGSKLKHIFCNYLKNCQKSSYTYQILCCKKCMWEASKYKMNVIRNETLWYLLNSKTIVWVTYLEMCCEMASLLIYEQINKGKDFLPVWWGFVVLFVFFLCFVCFALGFFVVVFRCWGFFCCVFF